MDGRISMQIVIHPPTGKSATGHLRHVLAVMRTAGVMVESATPIRTADSLDDHAVIIFAQGFGQLADRTLKRANIPYKLGGI
jgi:hypothetical protein